MRRSCTRARPCRHAQARARRQFFKEGDVVFTQRLAPALKDPMGQNVKVTSVQLLNQDLKDAGAMDADGVRQVLPRERTRRLQVEPRRRGEQPGRRRPARTSSRTTRSPTWPSRASCASRRCRLATEARGHNFPHLHHAKGRAQRRPRLPRAAERGLGRRTARRRTSLSSSSRRTSRRQEGPGRCAKVWRIGRVVDGNQSKNMITVCVERGARGRCEQRQARVAERRKGGGV